MPTYIDPEFEAKLKSILNIKVSEIQGAQTGRTIMETIPAGAFVSAARRLYSRIPAGHRWCQNCEAYTEHDKDYCKLCGTHFYHDGCPECSWWSEKILEEPDHVYEKLHHPGCHYEQLQNDPEAMDLFDMMSPAVRTFSEFFDRNIWPVRAISVAPRHIQDMWYEGTKENRCGCPETVIIYHLNTWGHWSRQGYEGEWEGGCTVRCPQCGHVFKNEW